MSIQNALCTNSACDVFLLYYATMLDGTGEPPPQFCPKCGSGVIDKCPHCHAETLANWPSQNNCHKCGERLRFDPDPITGKVSIVLDD
jgi:hypothetical protein